MINRPKETLKLAGLLPTAASANAGTDYKMLLETAPLSDDGKVESLIVFERISKDNLQSIINRINYAKTILKDKWLFQTTKVCVEAGTWNIYVGKYSLESK